MIIGIRARLSPAESNRRAHRRRGHRIPLSAETRPLNGDAHPFVGVTSPFSRYGPFALIRTLGKVSAIERLTDPTSLALRGLSERECARFRNRNLRQPGRGRRVHRVELRDWLGGLKLPVPACHQPLATLALAGDSAAVTSPVDCARCLAGNPDPFTPLVALDGGQLPLALEPGDAEQRPTGQLAATDDQASGPLAPGEGTNGPLT